MKKGGMKVEAFFPLESTNFYMFSCRNKKDKFWEQSDVNRIEIKAMRYLPHW
jgi:hypothetical protein